MFKDTTFVLISRGFALVFGILITVIIARSLGPALKGTYDLTLLILRTSAMLVMFGLSAANVYLGAREPDKLAEFAGNSIVAALALGLSTTCLLEIIMFMPSVQSYLVANNVNLLWMRWLVAVIPFIILQQFLQEIIRAAGRILVYSILSVIQFPINLLLLVGFLWSPSHYLKTAIMAWILAQIIVCVLTLILVLQVTRFQVRLNTQLFIRSLSFGIQLHPGNIAQFLNYRLDIFLVGIFLTPTEIGLYATATLLAERLWEIPAAIRTALMFHVSARPEQAINLTTRTCRMIVIITTPVYLGILLFAGTIIPIVFGGDYLPAVKPFILLLPGIWTLSIGRIPAIYLASSGRPIIGTWSAVASLVFTTILDIILIPRIGIAGAAIASSVAYSLSAIIIAYIFIQDTHLPYGQLLIPQNEDWVFMKKIFARTIRATKT